MTRRHPSPDVAIVRDRKGRKWTITVTTAADQDDLSPWLDMTPAERVELVGECVLDGLRLEGKLDVPRLRRVYRVSERPSRPVPDRGGYAVGFHARPRATKDIDILVDRALANAKRVRAALIDFWGSDAPNITLEKLTDPRTLVVLGIAPVRIDVLTAIDGVPSFALAWKRRAVGVYGRTPANFISRDDLIRAKLASGRPQDLADVDVLRRAASRSPKPKPAKRTR